MRKHAKKVDRRGTNSSRFSHKSLEERETERDESLSVPSQGDDTARSTVELADQLLAEKTTEVVDLQAQVDALMKGHKQLAANLDDRLRELATLTTMLEARDEEVFARLSRELPAAYSERVASEELVNTSGNPERVSDQPESPATVVVDQSQVIELSKEVDALRTEIESTRGELLTARKQITTLERERSKAKAELQARFEETASLTMRLEAATEELVRLKQQLAPVITKSGRRDSQKKGFSAPKLFSIWNLWADGKDNAKTRKNIKFELDVVRRSKYFDAGWYLATYPDVAQSGMDAAVHFVKFGAMEGRDPGPLFSTKTYLLENPDAVEKKMNPLMHSVIHGNGNN